MKVAYFGCLQKYGICTTTCVQARLAYSTCTHSERERRHMRARVGRASDAARHVGQEAPGAVRVTKCRKRDQAYKAGMREGKGKYVFAEGGLFEGTFADGVLEGSGTQVSASGDVFQMRQEGCAISFSRLMDIWSGVC